MHELSIALNILEISQQEARQRGGKVTAVHLKLGPLAGVVKEALCSAWELARSGSPLEEAVLEIEEVPLRAHCPACGVQQQVFSIQQLCCSQCGTLVAEIVSGRELEIVALEIEL